MFKSCQISYEFHRHFQKSAPLNHLIAMPKSSLLFSIKLYSIFGLYERTGLHVNDKCVGENISEGTFIIIFILKQEYCVLAKLIFTICISSCSWHYIKNIGLDDPHSPYIGAYVYRSGKNNT